MPEWTAERRHAIYQCLAEGNLEQAVSIVSPQLDLKKNDLRPIDKAAMALGDQPPLMAWGMGGRSACFVRRTA